uniref:Uncharacterized protein n=1 Tax=Arundo donax TaxID=35708 RepID=A0A0A9CIS1_ARUDO
MLQNLMHCGAPLCVGTFHGVYILLAIKVRMFHWGSIIM